MDKGPSILSSCAARDMLPWAAALVACAGMVLVATGPRVIVLEQVRLLAARPPCSRPRMCFLPAACAGQASVCAPPRAP